MYPNTVANGRRENGAHAVKRAQCAGHAAHGAVAWAGFEATMFLSYAFFLIAVAQYTQFSDSH